MNHPTREEWMSFLYDELTDEQRANLAAHLAVCPDCKTCVNDWRATGNDLRSWQLPVRRARFALQRPVLRWAAAAVIMLCVGFGVGRFTTAASADKIRAAVEPAVRGQLREEFARMLRSELEKASAAALDASRAESRQLIGDFAKVYESNRAEDNQAVYEALNKLETQRLADNATLRKELETVAVMTDFGFRRTQQQMLQLADYTQPANTSTTPEK